MLKTQPIIFMPKIGQHFLKSPIIAKRIANSAKLSKEDCVVEIGPGKGVLTRELLKQTRKVVAFEKDVELLQSLKEKFKREVERKHLLLIEGDILEFNIENLKELPKNYKLVANIPYYITGNIIRKFLSIKKQPSLISILIQKEVAERIKSKKDGLLSLSIKAYGKVEYVEKIKKTCFSPNPKVDSALIRISNISKENFKSLNEELFFKILKTGFLHPRKKLLSNISEIKPKEEAVVIFEKLDIPQNSRPEDLKIQKWLELAKIFS